MAGKETLPSPDPTLEGFWGEQCLLVPLEQLNGHNNSIPSVIQLAEVIFELWTNCAGLTVSLGTPFKMPSVYNTSYELLTNAMVICSKVLEDLLK